jgi:hypothetical protein
MIGSILGVGQDDFNIKRKHVVREMKEVHLKLSDLGLTNGAILEASRGQLLVQGKYQLKISFIQLFENDASDDDGKD